MRTLEEQLTINRNCKFHPESKEELQKLVNDPKINLGLIDTSNISDMSWLFKGTFDRLDFSGIETWDVSNVKNMQGMFIECELFNEPLNSWNVSNVTNMSGMFYNCKKFNQSLHDWNVENVENMGSMFVNCCNFNQAIGTWNVSKVTDMHDMFRSCVNFNQDLTQWKVKETCNTQNMFTDTPLRLANVKEVFTEKQLLNSASQIFLNELTLK